MTEETLQAGVRIAEQALEFAMWQNGQITGKQAREAIKLLFGDEVDTMMVLKYGPVHTDEQRGEG